MVSSHIKECHKMGMRINGAFVRNFSEWNNKTLVINTFFMYRYHISNESSYLVPYYINYLALNIKDAVVNYNWLDKCYKDWENLGIDKRVEATKEEIDNIKKLLSEFLGLNEYVPLSDENKTILDSFLESNDGGMFYVYLNTIDFSYNFLLNWRNHEVIESAKTINVPKSDIRAFNFFSGLITNLGESKFLNKISGIFQILKGHMYNCVKNIIKLYSAEGFEFNEHSPVDKIFIMNVLTTIYNTVECFSETMISVVYAMNSNNIKTGTEFDNYLALYQFTMLANKCNEIKKEYDIEESPIEDARSCDSESIWPLPKDFFNLPSADKNEYFGDIKEVAKDIKSFECLINYLASEGYIEYNDSSKRILAFVLTGKSKPYEKIEKIEWKKSCNDLTYICRHFYNFNGRYNRIPNFFKYEGDDKPLKSNYADNASKNLQQKINELFPNLEKSK